MLCWRAIRGRHRGARLRPLCDRGETTRESSSAMSGSLRSPSTRPSRRRPRSAGGSRRTAWGNGYASEGRPCRRGARLRDARAYGPRLIHGGMEPALAAGDGEDRHDPRPGRAISTASRAAGRITSSRRTSSIGSRHVRDGALPAQRWPVAEAGRSHRTKRRSPSLFARTRSADLRPSFFRLSMRLCTSAGARHRFLRDLDDDLAGLEPLLGGGVAGATSVTTTPVTSLMPNWLRIAGESSAMVMPSGPATTLGGRLSLAGRRWSRAFGLLGLLEASELDRDGLLLALAQHHDRHRLADRLVGDDARQRRASRRPVLPSNSRMTSPGWMPAAAAGPFSVTPATSAPFGRAHAEALGDFVGHRPGCARRASRGASRRTRGADR